jgi:hypothetical protein
MSSGFYDEEGDYRKLGRFICGLIVEYKRLGGKLLL